MSTEQKYAPRDSYANPSPQAAQNAAKTPPSVDSRQVYDAQTQLLKLIDEYWGQGGVFDPIEQITDLLYRWLTTPALNLAIQTNQDQLHTILSLINFLTALFEQTGNIEHTKKGGVNNG